MLHDILQSLLVLDIHLVADVPLPRPVVHHGGWWRKLPGEGGRCLRSHTARSWCGANKVVVVVAVRRSGKGQGRKGEQKRTRRSLVTCGFNPNKMGNCSVELSCIVCIVEDSQTLSNLKKCSSSCDLTTPPPQKRALCKRKKKEKWPQMAGRPSPIPKRKGITCSLVSYEQK